MTFLVLRPQAKCKASVNAFQAANLDAVACGLIGTEIDSAAIAQLPAKIELLPRENEQDTFIIVTSTVAAEQAVLLHDLWPHNTLFFAVGPSTAKMLKRGGIDNIMPHEARTEGLLALPQLDNIVQRNIVIMKGFGGRELLYNSLATRGANVTEWEVYKRHKIAKPLFTQDWHKSQIRCIIATSGEVIQAAFEYFEPQWLKTLSWIVVSQRTADIALTLGVTQFDISRDASDQALIDCARLFMQRERHALEH